MHSLVTWLQYGCLMHKFCRDSIRSVYTRIRFWHDNVCFAIAIKIKHLMPWSPRHSMNLMPMGIVEAFNLQIISGVAAIPCKLGWHDKHCLSASNIHGLSIKSVDGHCIRLDKWIGMFGDRVDHWWSPLCSNVCDYRAVRPTDSPLLQPDVCRIQIEHVHKVNRR